MARPPDKLKKSTVVGAVSDLLILALLVGGAGFGGYYLGIHEQMAPIELVPEGTENARPMPSKKSDVKLESKTVSPEKPALPKHVVEKQPDTNPKFWLSSSGNSYVGYSITVSVNGKPIDNFFGAGKLVEITNRLHAGDNEILFQGKQLGARFNIHQGDAKSVLTVCLVKGSVVSEDLKDDTVLFSSSCNGAETKDFSDRRKVAFN